MPRIDVPPLRVLVRAQTDGEELWYTGQCLEHDICAQAKSIDELGYEISLMLAGTIAIGLEMGLKDPLSDFDPAPAGAWQAWDRARQFNLDTAKPFSREEDGVHPMMMGPHCEVRLAEAVA